VRQHLHSGNSDNVRGYWSPYDLLGLFLSLMGRAPTDAKKWNFHLPLTAVYGRWCSQIAGRKPNGGAGPTPAIFQCTWHKVDGEDNEFFLGASLGGYEWDKAKEVGNWKIVLQTARFNLIRDTGVLQSDIAPDGGVWSFGRSPIILKNDGLTGTNFGNCAETYPFLDRFL